jgi:hypothetical protein
MSVLKIVSRTASRVTQCILAKFIESMGCYQKAIIFGYWTLRPWVLCSRYYNLLSSMIAAIGESNISREQKLSCAESAKLVGERLLAIPIDGSIPPARAKDMNDTRKKATDKLALLENTLTSITT